MNEPVLRRPRAADAAHLYALDSDPEVMHWINGGLPLTVEDFSREILPVYLAREEEPFGFWIIQSEDLFAGWVSLRRKTPNSAELGYRVRREWWGRGLATFAGSSLIARGFGHPDIARITATTYEENTGSRRVLEKLGMQLVRRYRLSADELAAGDTALSGGVLWDGDDLEYVIEREKKAATSS